MIRCLHSLVRLRPLAILPLLFVLAITGCRSGPREDPILKLSAEESLAEGIRLLEEEKYEQARKHLVHAFEVEPNSAAGRQALLLAADALFLDGGNQNLIQAEAKYRDFLNRFPTSDKGAYVQYQIGNSLFQRMEKPDRDQVTTHQALQAFEELIRIYPDSEHAEEAEHRMREIRSRLAEHELHVARFYYRFGLPRATVNRLEYLLEQYPDYPALDEVYYYLGSAHHKAGEPEKSHEWFTRLREEFPQSEYLAEIPTEGA
jgi:outer membrane protein assembly factor BamD